MQAGEDISRQLKYIPAQIKVIEHVTPKYICRTCKTIKQASKTELSPIPKAMAEASLISEVIVSKYDNHLPLYRQSKIFSCQGIDIPANTLGNWVMQSGGILQPLGQALKQELNNTKILQADETPVEILRKTGKGYMWVYHSCEPKNRFVLFEYSDNRAAATVENNLQNYAGILQTDGYSGYNKIRSQQEIIAIGCFAHCRRKFAEIVKLGQSGIAAQIIKFIQKLYQIETLAKDKQMSFIQRRYLRRKRAKPILRKIYQLLRTTAPRTAPKGALGKAIHYALSQWQYLYRYVNHGEAEIDNNWVENQIRPFALGRKNWLFIGNQKAANTASLLYSLIQTCKINAINPRSYLTYVLNQAHKVRRGDIDPKILLPQFIDKQLLV